MILLYENHRFSALLSNKLGISSENLLVAFSSMSSLSLLVLDDVEENFILLGVSCLTILKDSKDLVSFNTKRFVEKF